MLCRVMAELGSSLAASKRAYSLRGPSSPRSRSLRSHHRAAGSGQRGTGYNPTAEECVQLVFEGFQSSEGPVGGPLGLWQVRVGNRGSLLPRVVGRRSCHAVRCGRVHGADPRAEHRQHAAFTKAGCWRNASASVLFRLPHSDISSSLHGWQRMRRPILPTAGSVHRHGVPGVSLSPQARVYPQ